MWLLGAGIVIGAVAILLYREVIQALETALEQYRRRREIAGKTGLVMDEIGKLIAMRQQQTAGR
jgi:hypothetical protein